LIVLRSSSSDMKKIIVTFLLICSGLISHAQSAYKQPTDATDCTKILFQAILEKDESTLSNVLANDFSIISFQGREINRDLLIGSIAKGYLKVDSGMLSGIRTRNYSDVTVVTGSWNVKAKVESASFDGEIAFMAVCARVGGNWKVSMMQMTPVQ
jgi:hypothetical protein